ncbi:ABC transporter ATP-binding protein [Patescibacteria group bacterium]
MSLLNAKNLFKIYEVGDNKIHALDGVSLEIRENDFLAIVGKSGSGKSTLMHIMGLLDSPSKGELLLKGKDVSKLKPDELSTIRNQEIGFVFQSFNLLPRTSVLENVMLPLQYSEISRKNWKKMAEEAIKMVDLEDRMFNKSNELSGGQKQRVAMARALVNNPSIVFADEPTGNLDTKTGDEIEKLLRKLHSNGKTLVIVTHDEDLSKIAKRKITLSDGKIV